MTTITNTSTPLAASQTIEVDFSRHVSSMRLAASTKQLKVAYQIATASLEEKQVKEQPKQETLTTRQKFFRNIYAAMPDDKKASSLYKEFVEECSPIHRILKEKGIEKLELADEKPIKDVRAYNMSLYEDSW